VGMASEQIPGNDAALVKTYRDRLQRSTPVERMLALHDEPIDIAPNYQAARWPTVNSRDMTR